MKIIIYTFESPPTVYMLNRLCRELRIEAVILQTPLSFMNKISFIKYRLRKYGFCRVCDEAIFQFYYRLFIKRRDIRLSNKLFPGEYLKNKINIDKNIPVYRVSSINDCSARSLLSGLTPDIIFMQSREMVHEDVLRLARLGFIGCHPGILPEYRGAYAPFWAVFNLELEKLGFSIYLADKGLDTGKIIFSKNIEVDVRKGSFKLHCEYIMFKSIHSIISTLNEIQAKGISYMANGNKKSRVYSHISLSDYIQARKKLNEFMKH